MIDISEYKFKVGDEVITIDGERGEIVSICDCEECEKRGFHEPVWRDWYDDDTSYITNIAAKRGFRHFYKIGDYRFNEFNRDWVEDHILTLEDTLAKLREHLRTIDELMGGESKEG